MIYLARSTYSISQYEYRFGWRLEKSIQMMDIVLTKYLNATNIYAQSKSVIKIFWSACFIAVKLLIILVNTVNMFNLTLSWWWSQSCKNQSIDLLCKSMHWFLYERDLLHERVNPMLTHFMPLISFYTPNNIKKHLA